MARGSEANDSPGEWEEKISRFNLNQRLQHTVVMMSFLILVITGLPQLYPDNSWSEWLFRNLGGIYTTRLIHRYTGVVFVIAALYHLAYIAHHVLVRKQALSMILSVKDFSDALMALRYNLGLTSQEPRSGRYDFGQKFEYWGMFFGGALMIISGLMLMYPVWATKILPGQFIPAAKAAHGFEGIMAMLTILIWHLYSAHLEPGRFPIDTSIFTGLISRARMREEHPLEYEELLDKETPEQVTVPDQSEDATA